MTERQLVDYRDRCVEFLSWLLNVGKRPGKAEGYSPYTVYGTAYRTARFDLWLWEQKNEYKHPPDDEDAAAYMDYLAVSPMEILLSEQTTVDDIIFWTAELSGPKRMRTTR